MWSGISLSLDMESVCCLSSTHSVSSNTSVQYASAATVNSRTFFFWLGKLYKGQQTFSCLVSDHSVWRTGRLHYGKQIPQLSRDVPGQLSASGGVTLRANWNASNGLLTLFFTQFSVTVQHFFRPCPPQASPCLIFLMDTIYNGYKGNQGNGAWCLQWGLQQS